MPTRSPATPSDAGVALSSALAANSHVRGEELSDTDFAERIADERAANEPD
jgi:hypothetical protein